MVCAWRVRRGREVGQLNLGPSRLTPTEHWQEATSCGTLVTSHAGKVPARQWLVQERGEARGHSNRLFEVTGAMPKRTQRGGLVMPLC